MRNLFVLEPYEMLNYLRKEHFMKGKKVNNDIIV